MSATLVVKHLEAGFGAKTLFTDVNLVLAPGDVIGLVGANGAGKSTLLKLLAGREKPLAGSVTLVPADAIVGWLPQEVERYTEETIFAHLARRTGVAAAQADLDRATAAFADTRQAGAAVEDAYSTAFDRWLAIGAADLEERLGQALAEVGLAVEPATQMTTLSGGRLLGLGWRRCCYPVSTSCCSMSRPMILIWTAWRGWNDLFTTNAPALFSSPTTENFWPAA